MRINFVIVLILITLIIGGCGVGGDNQSVSPSEMDPNELPEVPAFQDEFTRDFIQSTEPVKEGYYHFQSGSNSFTMNFPERMIVVDESYSLGPDDRSEYLEFSHLKEDKEKMDILPVITMDYYNFMSSEESSKEGLSGKIDEELEFKQLETEENHNIEYADTTEGPYPGIAALVWNDNDQQIQIFTTFVCNDNLNEEECEESVESEKKKILDIISSIHFTKDESE